MKTMHEIIFRPAQPQDMEAVMELVDAAMKEMSKKGIDQWDELYPCQEDFLEDTERKEMYTGWIGQELASIYTVNQRFEEEYFKEEISWNFPEESAGCIHRLCVHPKFQGMGTGRRTLLDAQEKMRKMRWLSVRLDVFSKNPMAVHMYEKEGYEKKGSAVWRKGLFYLMEKKL